MVLLLLCEQLFLDERRDGATDCFGVPAHLVVCR